MTRRLNINMPADIQSFHSRSPSSQYIGPERYLHLLAGSGRDGDEVGIQRKQIKD